MGKGRKRYHRCSCCSNKAVWLYMPGRMGKVYYCDECVPRGCSCNLLKLTEFPISNNGITNNGITPVMYWDSDDVKRYIWGDIDNNEFEKSGVLEKKDNSTYYEILDDEGRREPCCEYEYSGNGFEIDIPDIMIKKHDLLNCIGGVRDSFYLYTNNIDWGKLIIYLRDNFGDELNYHIIFKDIESNIIDNFIIFDIKDGVIPILVKKQKIAKAFIKEIRKLARVYKYKKFHE